MSLSDSSLVNDQNSSTSSAHSSNTPIVQHLDHPYHSPPLKRQRTGEESDNNSYHANGNISGHSENFLNVNNHSYHPYPSSYKDIPPTTSNGYNHDSVPWNTHPPGYVHGNTKVIVMDEDDQSRSRNAKAQRRHREKRKAHLKSLEESVQLLTAQLDDARRQLGQSYASSSSRILGPGGLPSPISPNQKDYSQMQAENTYLREENADLRRQLYAYRSAHPGHMHFGPPPGPAPLHFDKPWDEVKSEHVDNGFMYGSGPSQPPGPPPHTAPPSSGPMGAGPPGIQVSPRVSNQDRVRQSADYTDGSMANESSSNPSTSSGFPTMDHLGRGARSRVMSASSAPSASPYLPATSFPADLRHHSLSHPNSAPSNPNNPSGPPSNPQTPTDGRFPPQVRYDHMYPPSGPPPHTLPRSTSGVYGVDLSYAGSGPAASGSGGDRESGLWGPESGPPPFAGPSYSLNFSQSEPGSTDWRETQ